MTDIQSLCHLIDPTIDWSTKDLTHISDLKLSLNTSNRNQLIQIIQSNYWPEAVPEAHIVRSEADRQRRSASIINDFIQEPLNGKKFLDFGCGNGDCVTTATNYGAIATGYDIKQHQEWSGQKGQFTTDLEQIGRQGPYDVVMIYDVLDHWVGPWEPVKLLKTWATPETTFYARSHPFSSRHGGHLYESMNKAYVHLFLTEEEIGKSFKGPWDVICPDMAYIGLITSLGMSIIRQQKTYMKPEPIIVSSLPFIIHQWHNIFKPDEMVQKVIETISIQFIDFTFKLMSFSP